MSQIPKSLDGYETFVLSRSANGALTVRFHTDGAAHTFTGTTNHDSPRLDPPVSPSTIVKA